MTTQTFAALRSHAGFPLQLLRKIGQRASLAHSRRALLRLDDHMLRDIGLTRHEAEVEATRARWDVPAHWRG